MKNEWILDVLSDVAKFADENKLTKTFEILLDALVIVAEEIAIQDLEKNSRAFAAVDRLIREARQSKTRNFGC